MPFVALFLQLVRRGPRSGWRPATVRCGCCVPSRCGLLSRPKIRYPSRPLVKVPGAPISAARFVVMSDSLPGIIAVRASGVVAMRPRVVRGRAALAGSRRHALPRLKRPAVRPGRRARIRPSGQVSAGNRWGSLVIERGAVDDGAEPAVISGERGDVGHLEGGVGQAALRSLLPGQVDGGGGQVQPDGGVTPLGQVQ
jgi:hypothetical protein